VQVGVHGGVLGCPNMRFGMWEWPQGMPMARARALCVLKLLQRPEIESRALFRGEVGIKF